MNIFVYKISQTFSLSLSFGFRIMNGGTQTQWVRECEKLMAHFLRLHNFFFFLSAPSSFFSSSFVGVIFFWHLQIGTRHQKHTHTQEMKWFQLVFAFFFFNKFIFSSRNNKFELFFCYVNLIERNFFMASASKLN